MAKSIPKFLLESMMFFRILAWIWKGDKSILETIPSSAKSNASTSRSQAHSSGSFRRCSRVTKIARRVVSSGSSTRKLGTLAWELGQYCSRVVRVAGRCCAGLECMEKGTWLREGERKERKKGGPAGPKLVRKEKRPRAHKENSSLLKFSKTFYIF
jgi:hypothetical protein